MDSIVAFVFTPFRPIDVGHTCSTRSLFLSLTQRQKNPLRRPGASAARRQQTQFHVVRNHVDVAPERRESFPDSELVAVVVDGTPVKVAPWASVLDACRAANRYVPTLCNHPRLEVAGTCRLCLVNTSNSKKPVPACATKVEPQMEITTNTPDLQKLVRGNLQFLLARHPKACMTCEVNGSCEFQDLIIRYHVEDKAQAPPAKAVPVHEWDIIYDESSLALWRDMDKCVRCGRCVRVCSSVAGMDILSMVGKGAEARPLADAGAHTLADSFCIECGQCSAVCPVGAIIEHPVWHTVKELLSVPQTATGRKHLVVQVAPSVNVALGEEFNLAPGTISSGKIVAALKALGFDKVFDTRWAADLTIMEEGSELVHRIQQGGPFPMFTSCCPAWVNLVEQSYPKYIENLSSARSPQGMLGSVIKKHFAKQHGISPSDIVSVSIMPCTAKKTEAARPELSTEGAADVDYVLTTRELARLIRHNHVPFAGLDEQPFDSPLGESSGAGMLFGVTGGVMEAALRTVYELVTKQPMGRLEVEQVRGLDGCKEATIDLNGTELRAAVVNGTAQARHLLEDIESGAKMYHFIEVMACPGGCIGGGGQPKSLDPLVLEKRMKATYSADERSVIRKSHENKEVMQLYKDWLGAPLSENAHNVLHTHYSDKSTLSKPRDDSDTEQAREVRVGQKDASIGNS